MTRYKKIKNMDIKEMADYFNSCDMLKEINEFCKKRCPYTDDSGYACYDKDNSKTDCMIYYLQEEINND